MKTLLSALLLLLGSLAWADEARAPYDYVKEVDGGKYVFVMLARPALGLLDPGAPEDVGVIETRREIRQFYRQSGLYPAGQTTPLWTVPWYAFTVFPATDGEHLVRLGPWASSTGQLALAFYTRGIETRRYLIRDLVSDPARLKRTVSHFFWLAEHHYDDQAGLFHLRTVDGNAYTFSVSSGAILP